MSERHVLLCFMQFWPYLNPTLPTNYALWEKLTAYFQGIREEMENRALPGMLIRRDIRFPICAAIAAGMKQAARDDRIA